MNQGLLKLGLNYRKREQDTLLSEIEALMQRRAQVEQKIAFVMRNWDHELMQCRSVVRGVTESFRRHDQLRDGTTNSRDDEVEWIEGD